MKNKKLLALTLCLVFAFTALLSGCGSESTNTEDTGDKAASETKTEDKAAEKKDEKKDDPVKVCFIPKNTGNPYFDNIDVGFQKAAEELGYEYTSVGPSTADATSQIPIIKSQIQRGVDVIAVYINSVDAMAEVFKEARSKGVKILFVGSDSPLKDTRDAFLGPVDMDVVGPELVELEGSFIDYSGKIGIVSGTTDSPDHNYWIEGMQKKLDSDDKFKDMEIIEIAYGNDDPQKSLTETEALLTKYPDLAGIIAPTTVAVAAAAQAIETAGSDVELTGLGTPNQMRRFIKNGTVKAFGLWVPADMGYAGGYLAMDMMNGEVDPSKDTSFEAGELGEIKIGEEGTITAGKFTIFDESNIDDYDF